jgi:hypothetical protein
MKAVKGFPFKARRKTTWARIRVAAGTKQDVKKLRPNVFAISPIIQQIGLPATTAVV